MHARMHACMHACKCIHQCPATCILPLPQAAYNLLFSLSKHTYDPDCAIFIKVSKVEG